jgi:hypothetical protein
MLNKNQIEDLFFTRRQLFEMYTNISNVCKFIDLRLTLIRQSGRTYFLEKYLLNRMDPNETIYILRTAILKKSIEFKGNEKIINFKNFEEKLKGYVNVNVVLVDVDDLNEKDVNKFTDLIALGKIKQLFLI